MSNVIEILINAKDATGDVLGGLAGGFSSMAGVAGGALTVGLGAATAGFAAVAGELTLATGEAMASQDAMAKLEAVLKATGGAVGITSAEFAGWATELQKTTRFSDESVMAAETLLLKFTNIGKEVFPDVLKSAADLAAMMGTDIAGAAQLLGKVMQSPAESIGLLERQIGKLSDAEKDQIKVMAEAGDVAGAQGLVLDILQGRVGGVAEAMGQTLSGQFEIFKNQMSDVQEKIGGAILPILQALMDNVIEPMLPLVNELASAFAAFVGALTGGDIGGAFDALMEFDSIRGIAEAFGITADTVSGFGAAIETAVARGGELFAILQEVWNAIQAELGPALQELTDAFSEQFPAMQSSAQDFMSFIVEAFGIIGPEILSGLAESIKTVAAIWREHGDTIMAVITMISKILVATLGGALVLAVGIIQAALAYMQGIFDMWSAIFEGRWGDAWNIALETIGNVFGILGEAFKTFFNLALSIVGTNLGEFVAVWEANFEMARIIVWRVFEIIGETITNALADAIEFVTGAFSTMVTNITSFGSKLFAAGRDAFDNAVSGIRSAIGQLWGLGSEAIDSLISGIRASGGQLFGVLAGIVNGAISDLKSLLGIGSPSKLFAEMGQNLMGGLSLGVESGQGRALAAVGNAVGTTASSAIGGVSSVNNTGASIGSLTINLQGVSDPRETARMVLREMRDLGLIRSEGAL